MPCFGCLLSVGTIQRLSSKSMRWRKNKKGSLRSECFSSFKLKIKWLIWRRHFVATKNTSSMWMYLTCVFDHEFQGLIDYSNICPGKSAPTSSPERRRTPKRWWGASSIPNHNNYNYCHSYHWPRWNAQKDEWSYYVETEVSGHYKCLVYNEESSTSYEHSST